MRIADYQSAADAMAASWVAAGLRGFAESVLSVVPAGFDAYCRLFHPAWTGEPERPVRWHDVARANDRVAHAAMQWPSLTGSYGFDHGLGQSQVWEREPDEGTLPEAQLPALMSVLAKHTKTPRRCWFAVWDGSASLMPGAETAPAFEIPYRRMLLFTGPIDAVRTSLCMPSRAWFQTPNLWWPDDRAWCVATEIDFMSTYVGGTSACVAELAVRDDLEVMRVAPSDGVTWASDLVNSPPA